MKEQLMLESCIHDLLNVYVRDTKAAIKQGSDTTFDERDPEDEFTEWILDRLLDELDWEEIKERILTDKKKREDEEEEEFWRVM